MQNMKVLIAKNLLWGTISLCTKCIFPNTDRALAFDYGESSHWRCMKASSSMSWCSLKFRWQKSVARGACVLDEQLLRISSVQVAAGWSYIALVGNSSREGCGSVFSKCYVDNWTFCACSVQMALNGLANLVHRIASNTGYMLNAWYYSPIKSFERERG